MRLAIRKSHVMTETDYHLEAIAGHFVIELDDPECPAEIRDDCEEWLASSETNRRIFNAIRRSWREGLVLARLQYRKHNA